MALDLHAINLFFCINISDFLNFFDFSDNGILVTFDTAWHEAGLDNGVHILFYNALGDHGIQVDILYGQCFNGLFIAPACVIILVEYFI